jgi:hypothetical protein
MMRSAGNFSPEWGYLAPAPSFMRTARIVLVATAVGATAGAGVVLSLVDRPATDGEKTAIAAHAVVVTSVQAATAPTVSMTPVTAVAPGDAATNGVANTPAMPAKITKTPAVATRSAPTAPPQNPAANGANASEANSIVTPQSSPGVAALADTPSGTTDVAPAGLPEGATPTPALTPPKKPARHATASPLRQIFSDHAGTSYFPNRGL